MILKSYQKNSKKICKHDPNRPPTGFAKPSLISEELCKFLNKPSGNKMANIGSHPRSNCNYIIYYQIFKILPIKKQLKPIAHLLPY